MKYDIFISYRRQGGYEVAKHLYDLLKTDGYKVSFDMDTLQHGNFDTELLSRVNQCKDFVLILNKGVFDRCFTTPKNDDWLRCELSYALEKGKNIIPVMLEGFTEFPKNLPEDIAGVAMKNGPKYDKYYFDNFYQRLKDKFLLTTAHKQKHKTRSMMGIGAAAAIFAVAGFFYWNAMPQEVSNHSVQKEVVDLKEEPDSLSSEKNKGQKPEDVKRPKHGDKKQGGKVIEPPSKTAETPPPKNNPLEALIKATNAKEMPNGDGIKLTFKKSLDFEVRFVLASNEIIDVKSIDESEELKGNWKNGDFLGNGTLYRNDGSTIKNIQNITLK